MSQSCWTGSTCPTDWLYFNGSCYRAYNTELSWLDAKTFCQENQGELLSINSDGEQQFVYQHIAVNKTLWIGLVKDRSLAGFRWSKGEGLTYLNWIPGEGNVSGHENCGEMTDYGSFHGQWNDKPCSATQPYICVQGDVIFLTATIGGYRKHCFPWMGCSCNRFTVGKVLDKFIVPGLKEER